MTVDPSAADFDVQDRGHEAHGRRTWIEMCLGALGLSLLNACGAGALPDRRVAAGSSRSAPDGRAPSATVALPSGLSPVARLALLLGPWPADRWRGAAGFADRFANWLATNGPELPVNTVDAEALAGKVEAAYRAGQPLALSALDEDEAAWLRGFLIALYGTPRAGAALLGQPMPGCRGDGDLA